MVVAVGLEAVPMTLVTTKYPPTSSSKITMATAAIIPMSIGRDNPPSRPAGLAENNRGMALARGAFVSALALVSSFLLTIGGGAVTGLVSVVGVGVGIGAGTGVGAGAGGGVAVAVGGFALFHF